MKNLEKKQLVKWMKAAENTIMNSVLEQCPEELENMISVNTELLRTLELEPPEGTSGLVRWPLFLGTAMTELNVCSITFAALTLLIRDGKEDANEHKERNLLGSSIYSIVSLALYDVSSYEKSNYVYWPQNYVLGTRQIQSGTINQTTLCLSLLAKQGFLTKNNVSEAAYEKRIEFVVKSIKWILTLAKKSRNYYAWTYAEKAMTLDDTEKEIESAVLPTFFCVKTLNRYVELFSEDKEVFNIVSTSYPGLIETMRKSVKLGCKYFESSQQKDGAIGMNSASTSSSYIHSLLALEILLSDYAGREEAIYSYLDYITKGNPKKMYANAQRTVFENYRYTITRRLFEPSAGRIKSSRPSERERYEIFIETIIIISGIKIVDYLNTQNRKMKYLKKIKGLMFLAYRSLEKRVKEKSGQIRIEGRRESEEDRYPIYCIYHFSTCIYDMYNKDDIKKYFRYPYIKQWVDSSWPFYLMAGTLILLGFICDPVNTYITAVFAGLSFLVGWKRK